MSASQKKPWLRFIKRAKLQGGEGGKELRSFRGEAAYIRRLRRLEVVVLTLTMKLKIEPKALDMLLDDMLLLKDVEGASGGDSDSGDPIRIPQEGAPDGEASGEARAVLSDRAGLDALLEESGRP